MKASSGKVVEESVRYEITEKYRKVFPFTRNIGLKLTYPIVVCTAHAVSGIDIVYKK